MDCLYIGMQDDQVVNGRQNDTWMFLSAGLPPSFRLGAALYKLHKKHAPSSTGRKPHTGVVTIENTVQMPFQRMMDEICFSTTGECS
jgi:hypothetical protein